MLLLFPNLFAAFIRCASAGDERGQLVQSCFCRLTGFIGLTDFCLLNIALHGVCYSMEVP